MSFNIYSIFVSFIHIDAHVLFHKHSHMKRACGSPAMPEPLTSLLAEQLLSQIPVGEAWAHNVWLVRIARWTIRAVLHARAW